MEAYYYRIQGCHPCALGRSAVKRVLGGWVASTSLLHKKQRPEAASAMSFQGQKTMSG